MEAIAIYHKKYSTLVCILRMSSVKNCVLMFGQKFGFTEHYYKYKSSGGVVTVRDGLRYDEDGNNIEEYAGAKNL